MQLARVIEGSGGECQDRLGVFGSPIGVVLVVADGAGGMGGGAEAAETAVRTTEQATGALSTPDDCCKLLYKLDSELSKQMSGGQTTCVVVVVSPSEIYGASVGDSVAWLIGDSGIINLTGFQVRKPLVGSGMAQPVPFKSVRLKAKLLLASDGLVKYATHERICGSVIRADVEVGAHALKELVRYPSGALPDDVAIILVDLTS